jgi:hypothetical protein
MMWMLSASRSWMWLRRSREESIAETESGMLAASGGSASGEMFVAIDDIKTSVQSKSAAGDKKPASAGILQRGLMGWCLKPNLAYPTCRRSAQQHAQQAAGMGQQKLILNSLAARQRWVKYLKSH